MTVRQLKLVDAQGKLLAHILPTNTGHGAMLLLNAAGKLHTQLSANADGAGILSARGRDGKPLPVTSTAPTQPK